VVVRDSASQRPAFDDILKRSTQPHGTFLMHGNFCVAQLDDRDPKALCEVIIKTRRDTAAA
jgi:hypothetical protein